MRRLAFVLGFAVALAASAAAQVANVQGRMIDGRSFIVPDDGYGTAECLKGGKESCGQVVADSWCEAHGFAAAAHFGAVDPGEITGAVGGPGTAPKPRGYLVITCKD